MARGGIQLGGQRLTGLRLQTELETGQRPRLPRLQAIELQTDFSRDRIKRLAAQKPQNHVPFPARAPPLPGRQASRPNRRGVGADSAPCTRLDPTMPPTSFDIGFSLNPCPRKLGAPHALVRDYAQRAFVDRGMVADLAYHGGQGENPHAHIMLTTRTLGPEGFGPKNRDWNKKEQLATWREDWAASANRALERHGHAERIDHRTLVAQRDEALQRGDTARAETLDRDPEIHLGRAAWMMLRTGEANERTRRNDQIAEGNRDREQERAAGHEAIRTIQEQIRDLIRHVAEKVKEKVKGLVRGEDRGPQSQPEPDVGPSR